jgi:glycosyltransferase involved in cell wall biosynthesis
MIKRLCIFTISFAYNRQGIINYLEKIMPADVELFLFVPKGCKGKYYSKRIKIYESKKGKYSCFLDFRKFCKKNKIERIINLGSLPQEGLYMLFASLFKKTDFICYLVIDPLEFLNQKINFWSVKSFFQTIFLFPLSLFSKKFLVCSKDIAKICKKFILHVSQLQDTVNTDIFKQKNKKEVRKKLNLPLNEKIVIFVGRIIYEKGIDFIFNSAIKNPNISYILVGEKSPKLKVPKISNIIFINPMPKEKLVDYYVAADLCLFPSRGEGFGLVPREAMACGTPAIVSDIRGLRMIEPSIKTRLNHKAIDEEIKSFFSLSEKDKQKISKTSREFILDECSEKISKPLYIRKLLY